MWPASIFCCSIRCNQVHTWQTKFMIGPAGLFLSPAACSLPSPLFRPHGSYPARERQMTLSMQVAYASSSEQRPYWPATPAAPPKCIIPGEGEQIQQNLGNISSVPRPGPPRRGLRGLKGAALLLPVKAGVSCRLERKMRISFVSPLFTLRCHCTWMALRHLVD